MIEFEDPTLPTARAVDRDEVRDAFKGMASLVKSNLPAGREQSLVLTKLDEAAMWSEEAFKRVPLAASGA